MDVGRWVFLATTYDAATGVVQHYCDGQAVGRTVLKSRTPAVLGPASFGNWDADPSTPDAAWVQDQLHNQKVRNFVGRLDDLAILARALSAREIATLYESGKP
jgi:predicted dinucleotide-binding enzyme